MDFWRMLWSQLLEIGCDSVHFLDLSGEPQPDVSEYIDFSSCRSLWEVSVELKKRLRFSSFLLYVSSVCVAFKQEQYAVSYLKWLSPGVGLTSQPIDSAAWWRHQGCLSAAAPVVASSSASSPEAAAVSDTGSENSISSPALSREQRNPSEKPSSRLHPSHWPELGEWWTTLIDFHFWINPT